MGKIRVMTGIFITGTDTGIGKTMISAGLARALKRRGYDVGVMKPVQSGAGIRNGELYSQDGEVMISAIEGSDEAELVCPFLFKEELAPGVAAQIEGKVVDLRRIKEAYSELEKRHDIVIVEGAGGIAVPLKNKTLVSDLIHCLGVPAIVVARTGLGTINHTFLTIEHAQRSGITIIGVIINCFKGGIAEETNPKVIEDLTGVPILGIVPHVSAAYGRHEKILSLVEKNVDLEKIISFMSFH
ncbi:MAG TPA: dethiobiotin synthase [Candidatus Methanoperedens sp.]|nr:dethiobiotin synthase [Candidatus Methanoperedens sp.]HLB70716.1 dethiobiotin synthase [Candidatus Methanoperedens sp.]